MTNNIIPMANGSIVLSCTLNEIVGSLTDRVEGWVLAHNGQEFVSWYVWRDSATNGKFEAVGGQYFGNERMSATLNYEIRAGISHSGCARLGRPQPAFEGST